MGMTLFITDPVVAAAYRIHPAEFVSVPDDAEALYLLRNSHAYTLEHRGALPPAYYVDPTAPLPFVPFPDLSPPSTQPALMTIAVDAVGGTFTLTFGGQVDTEAATGRFVIVDTEGLILASGTYPQPAGTTFDAAAGLLEAALVPFAATIAVVKTGATLELSGVGATIIGAVSARLTIQRVAAQPAPPPAPEPAPTPSSDPGSDAPPAQGTAP